MDCKSVIKHLRVSSIVNDFIRDWCYSIIIDVATIIKNYLEHFIVFNEIHFDRF